MKFQGYLKTEEEAEESEKDVRMEEENHKPQNVGEPLEAQKGKGVDSHSLQKGMQPSLQVP